MTTAQLPLIEELSLDHIKDSTPVGITRKFVAPSSLSYSLVLLALLAGPLPLEQMQHMVGVANGAALVVDLRQLGLDMPCYQVPEPHADGQVSYRTVCALSTADIRHVKRWITISGGRHA